MINDSKCPAMPTNMKDTPTPNNMPATTSNG